MYPTEAQLDAALKTLLAERQALDEIRRQAAAYEASIKKAAPTMNLPTLTTLVRSNMQASINLEAFSTGRWLAALHDEGQTCTDQYGAVNFLGSTLEDALMGLEDRVANFVWL